MSSRWAHNPGSFEPAQPQPVRPVIEAPARTSPHCNQRLDVRKVTADRTDIMEGKRVHPQSRD